jgi:antitoxin CptB
MKREPGLPLISEKQYQCSSVLPRNCRFFSISVPASTERLRRDHMFDEFLPPFPGSIHLCVAQLQRGRADSPHPSQYKRERTHGSTDFERMNWTVGRINPAATVLKRAQLERQSMSGPALTSAALDERRRRILFRAWRRGVREMDLIMGSFADAHLPTMNEDEVAEFERLLDLPDPQALAWIIGGEHPPREFDTPLFARLCGSR